MSRPGDRLRAVASHLFDVETMEHLIDPVVADLQLEYAEASRAGRVWRRRWVRAVGYAAILRVGIIPARVFLVLVAALTVLLELPFWFDVRFRFTLTRALYLMPQALMVAVPISFTLAVAWARRLVNPSRVATTAVVASSAMCAAFAFVTFAWWVPSANQAFRISAARELGGPAVPVRGLPELTIGELRGQMKWARAARADWRALEYTYYSRWAFPWASLSLGLFVLSVRRRGAGRRFMWFAGVPIVLGYYALMFFSREYSLSEVLSPMAGAWMPNVVTLLAAGAIAIRATPRQGVA